MRTLDPSHLVHQWVLSAPPPTLGAATVDDRTLRNVEGILLAAQTTEKELERRRDSPTPGDDTRMVVLALVLQSLVWIAYNGVGPDRANKGWFTATETVVARSLARQRLEGGRQQ